MRRTKSNIGAFAFAAIAGAVMIVLAIILLPIILGLVVAMGVIAAPLLLVVGALLAVFVLSPGFILLSILGISLGGLFGGWCGGALLLALTFALSWILVYVLYEYVLTKALKQKRSVFTLWICTVLVWVLPGVIITQFLGTSVINAQLQYNPILNLLFGSYSVSISAGMTMWASVALALVFYPIVYVVNALSRMFGYDFVG